MSNVVTFKGTLLAGPPKSSTSGFPSGLVNASFELKPPNKVATVLTHQVRSLSSPSSYVALDVGENETVTEGTFLYLRTSASMLVRVTYDDGDGGDVVSVVPVDGVFVSEAPTAKFIKGLEAQGTGVIEYFVSGNQ